MGIKITTSNFEVYDKFSMFNLSNKIVFENTKNNRKILSKIINNINYSDKYIDALISKDKIIINKRKPIDFKVYYRQ